MQTRRCSQRCFLLKPGDAMNQILLYCLAYAAAQHGILIHGYSFLSNHYHMSLTDPLGTLPQFLCLFHGLVARAGNRLRGRGESFWDPRPTSSVELSDAPTFMKHHTYVLTNPVKHGLKRHPSHWEGLQSSPGDLGRVIKVKRPEKFFRTEKGLPDEVTLTLTKPPLCAELSDEEYVDQVKRQVEAETLRLKAARKKSGKRLSLSPNSLENTSPHGRPKGGTIPRRDKIKPTLACAGNPRRFAALKLGLRAWRQAYRYAWTLWKTGRRDVVFPLGTFSMRVNHSVCCGLPAP